MRYTDRAREIADDIAADPAWGANSGATHMMRALADEVYAWHGLSGGRSVWEMSWWRRALWWAHAHPWSVMLGLWLGLWGVGFAWWAWSALVGS